MLALSHGVYWKRTIEPCHQARSPEDLSGALHYCTIEKRNLWDDKYTCNMLKRGTLDFPTIDAIQIEHTPSRVYFWDNPFVENHEIDSPCMYPSCNTEKSDPEKHVRLKTWIAIGKADLEEFMKKEASSKTMPK